MSVQDTPRSAAGATGKIIRGVATYVIVLRAANSPAFHCLVLADVRIGKDPVFFDQQVDGQSGKREQDEKSRNNQQFQKHDTKTLIYQLAGAVPEGAR
jgi:hypothetical protein